MMFLLDLESFTHNKHKITYISCVNEQMINDTIQMEYTELMSCKSEKKILRCCLKVLSKVRKRQWRCIGLGSSCGNNLG